MSVVVFIEGSLIINRARNCVGWVYDSQFVRNRQGETIGLIQDGKIVSPTGEILYHIYHTEN